MVPISKLVARRLQAQSAVGPHPDADQLTALMEKALDGPERTNIVAHLSTCADCREIVFLAMPQFELDFAPLAQPVRAEWLRWPVLRWGTVAACALVVGAAVTLHYQSEPVRRSVAIPTSDEAPQVQTYVTSNELSSRDSVAHASKDARSNQPKQANDAVAAPVAPAPMRQFRYDADLNAQGQDKQGQDKGDQFRFQKQEADGPGVRREEKRPMAAAPEAARSKLSEEAMGKAKEPLEKKGEESAGAGAGALRVEQKTAAVAGGLVLAPRWTLSSDGTLQRSLNGGKTWDTISVAKNAKFRAVTAIGTEIWVGGDAGVLYHSSDAGGSWTQVKPAAGGKLLSADIIGVEFTDTQHGKLITAGGDAWTTVDGGQSWTSN